MGSSTLARWIQANLERDARGAAADSGRTPAKDVNQPGAERPSQILPRQADGDGSLVITGIPQQWHTLTFTLSGPFAHERDVAPNPFTDYRMELEVTHESAAVDYAIPGYFAADGRAAETSAEAGYAWRAHFVPDRTGTWNYRIRFMRGQGAAIGGDSVRLPPYDGIRGQLLIEPSTASGSDFRAHGQLRYVGQRYLQFAGSQRYFLKLGADSPETLLASIDFDNTLAGKPEKAPLKSWSAHLADWREGDPYWKEERGKGLIGALNYLASRGVNAISFLTYNAGGDGDNVWPFVERNEKLHYDCSKLDQWGRVFDHATSQGLFLHFKLQETELDDDRHGPKQEFKGPVPEALDGGKLGVERKLYCREVVARFAHALALNWNIGEENTQSLEEVREMAAYLRRHDAYRHPIVLHTFPNQQEERYGPLLGADSPLDGVSLQNSWDSVYQQTQRWVEMSTAHGKPWVVANDEQNSPAFGVPADPGYGVSSKPPSSVPPYDLHAIRQETLWGNLMAGGAGVEYYFGYQLPQNDLNCEDFRSRERSWDYGRVALDFFQSQAIPFWQMLPQDALMQREGPPPDGHCLAKPGEVYLVYLRHGGQPRLDLRPFPERRFSLQWFNPRDGGIPQDGSPAVIAGGQVAGLGEPPSDKTLDWLAVVRRQSP
jgi:hypothetical protein